MNKLNNFVTPIIIAGLIFLTIELILRALVVGSSQLGNYGFNSKGLGDLLPDKNFIDIGVKRLPYLVITNSQGLRNEEEIDFSSDTYRILTIGDSFTYCPYVNNQDTWQAVLEEKLRNKYPNRKIQVLNAGVAGYTITDELEYLKEKGIKIKPDLVVLGIYANDINDLKEEKRAIFARSKQKARAGSFYKPLLDFAKKTALFNFLEKNKAKILVNKIKNGIQNTKDLKSGDDAEYWQEYLEKLEEFINYCQDNNLSLLIIIFPQADFEEMESSSFDKKLTLYGKKTDILNLALYYQEESIDDLYLVPYNQHLSAYGYVTTAQAVFNYLFSKKTFL